METTKNFGFMKTFKISSKCLGSVIGFPNDKNDKGTHNKFEITVINSRTGTPEPDIIITFDFYGSIADHDKGKTDLNKEDLIDAFRCFIDDSLSGLGSFDDFCDNFGYDNDSMNAFRIYQSCQESTKKARKLGLSESSMCNILNKLSDEGY